MCEKLSGSQDQGQSVGVKMVEVKFELLNGVLLNRYDLGYLALLFHGSTDPIRSRQTHSVCTAFPGECFWLFESENRPTGEPRECQEKNESLVLASFSLEEVSY